MGRIKYKFERIFGKVVTVVVALAVVAWCTPLGPAVAYALSSNIDGIESWTAEKTADAYIFTVETGGNVGAVAQKSFAIEYASGHNGNNNLIQTTLDCKDLKGGWYQDIEGAAIETTGSSVVITVPKSYFADGDFTVSFAGSSVSTTEMKTVSSDSGNSGGDKKDDKAEDADKGDADKGDSAGKDDAGKEDPGKEHPKDDAPAVYNGIEIDGDFSDWNAVKKYDFKDVDLNGKPKGWDTLDKMALVWDGDWVYLYFESKADDPGAMTGAGPHGNGQFSITTDLGNETLVQLQRGPAVAGIDGAKVACNNYEWAQTPHKWEVAIPASALGDYKETISFGAYKLEPTIIGAADLQGSKGGDFDGIVYDGKYDDWTCYPHDTIEYATSGTHEHVVDSKAALYADSEQTKLFGHVVTSMPAHLEEAGGEFTSAVAIKINGNEDLMLTPRFIAVDAEGNINWNPTLSGLEKGTYEFYLTSTTVDGSSKNINELQADDVIYGRAMITVGSNGKDEMEWEIDIPTLAANLHKGWGQSKEAVAIDPNDIKTFEAQYGRLGQEWVKTAGTSTAPFVGIALCIAVVATVLAVRSRKRESVAPVATQSN